MDLRITTLENNHEKKSFSCGLSMLDNYIQRQAKQDIKRDLSACFVLVDEESYLVLASPLWGILKHKKIKGVGDCGLATIF